ncbi:hypothetical protein A2333_02020 [Candidatus Wolfebacteria bacterium RIFOXYB2_FULL_49_7]|uniref:Uncharacterized protein n=1 Tax=Candidatus Wolfebacteria bacterium RIFOXYB1_FULL_54_12 TaxID=1802559 RepID=A0A1F8DWJ1_9BACT|nr:MAG: hypothetical protein A2372_03730 [Candidatus Wolfebacteria bacterium RIFOXYB1_FULL_54_12]OGM93445.1 MAG: hypothetical protein A2333_02020 [Candidatus Wolfebacteria bacterium RIFOXYB2_FULL_49_7]
MVKKLNKIAGILLQKLKSAISGSFSDVRKGKKRGVLALILAGVFLGFYGTSAGVLWLLFLAFLFYEWDSRVIGTLAIISLATCPILLALKQDAYAEQMAVYAYFFLVMTVVLQIIEYKHYPEEFKEDIKNTE